MLENAVKKQKLSQLLSRSWQKGCVTDPQFESLHQQNIHELEMKKNIISGETKDDSNLIPIIVGLLAQIS